METNFRIFKDNAAEAELEGALGAGSDLVIVGSPSEYFEGRTAQKAIHLMKKYPERKIFVTDPVSSDCLQKVLEKANSGANLFDTYIYAENLSEALRA